MLGDVHFVLSSLRFLSFFSLSLSNTLIDTLRISRALTILSLIQSRLDTVILPTVGIMRECARSAEGSENIALVQQTERVKATR